MIAAYLVTEDEVQEHETSVDVDRPLKSYPRVHRILWINAILSGNVYLFKFTMIKYKTNFRVNFVINYCLEIEVGQCAFCFFNDDRFHGTSESEWEKKKLQQPCADSFTSFCLM